MNAEQIIEHLLVLDGFTKGYDRSSYEIQEAWLQKLQVVRNMNLSEAEDVLMGILEEPHLDPELWGASYGLVETVLERLMEVDMDRAIAIAKKMDIAKEESGPFGDNAMLLVIPSILSIKNPEAAIRFLQEHNFDHNNPNTFKTMINIGHHAAKKGPEALLALESLIGTSTVNSSLEYMPAEHCKAFADRWYAFDQDDCENKYHVRSVLESWSRLAPAEAIEWYRSKPELGKDLQLSFSMINIILHHDEAQGLDFAEGEFQGSAPKARRLFTFAVNSHMEPELWVKLAERMPEDAKPRHEEFMEHLSWKASYGPRAIAAAARCYDDDTLRYQHLKTTLTHSGSGDSRNHHWTPKAIADARKQLKAVSLSDEQRGEILELFDKVAAMPVSPDPFARP